MSTSNAPVPEGARNQDSRDPPRLSKKRRLYKSPRARANEKLFTLTLEEKILLLYSPDPWMSRSIPEKGIPALSIAQNSKQMSGPPILNGNKFSQFPCASSLAATWNKELLYEIGQHFAREARQNSVDMLLVPTFGLHRHPLKSDVAESYSEDPVLTGKLASRYISGLQSRKVSAILSPFVIRRESDTDYTVTQIAQRPLRELYLRPYEIAIREAKPWAIFPSKKKINDASTDEDPSLLERLLRRVWHFDGAIVSAQDIPYPIGPSLSAGCDFFLPLDSCSLGNDREWRSKEISCAITDDTEGLLSDSLIAPYDGSVERSIKSQDIDRAARNWLTLVERVTGDNIAEPKSGRAMEVEVTQALIRRAGHEGLTLLKNDDSLLPLSTQKTRLAVIGPHAKRGIPTSGGGSSSHIYQSASSPYMSISRMTETAKYARGCHMHQRVPLSSEDCRDKQGDFGVSMDWRPEGQYPSTRDYLVTYHGIDIEFFGWNKAPVEEIDSPWTVWMTTYLKLPEAKPSKRTIAFMSIGPGRLYVNGELAIDLWDWTDDGHAVLKKSLDHYIDVESKSGEQIKLEVEFCYDPWATNQSRYFDDRTIGDRGGFRIGFRREDDDILLQEAVEVAASADVAIVVVGLDPGWEAEGVDRPNLDLPFQGSQDRLIEAVARANPRTVVVNQSGCPVSMPWVNKVPAIIQAWYQGQEASEALADVLFGVVTPSGKLPTTFPKRIEDTPAFHNWPYDSDTMVYGEGLFIGYRHYERAKIEPLFPFGHGLSYTTFKYGPVEVTPDVLEDGGTIKVTLAVSNKGNRPGSEIVQAYIHDERSGRPRPVKELAAFEKVFLNPGQTKHVALILDKHSVGYYDNTYEPDKQWIAEEGIFQVLIGSSSTDIRRTGKFSVNKSFTWLF